MSALKAEADDGSVERLNRLPAPPVTKRELALLVVILVAACAIRVAHVLAMRDFGDFDQPQMDAAYHVEWARAFARGERFQPGPFFRAPLYPWLLGTLLGVFGDGLLVPRLVQALLGTLGVGLIWAIGRRAFGPRVGLLAAFFLAFHWVSVFFDGELLLETLAVPLYLAGLWLTLKADADGRPRTALAAGIAWGLGALTRPNVLPILPLLWVWLWWRRGRQRGAALAIACALGSAAMIAPISAYNALSGHDRVLIASQGGVNLWIGNNPQADGSTAIVPGTREDWWGGFDDAVALAERAEGRELAPSEVSRHYTRKALSFALEQPRAWLTLIGRKLRWLAMDWELGNNEEPRFLAERYSPIGAWTGCGFGALLALAGAGVWSARKRSLATWPLLAFVVVYAVTIVLFFVNARFRLPVVAVLTLYASLGAWSIVDAVRARRWVAAFALVLAVGGIFALSRALVPGGARSTSISNGHLMLGHAAARRGAWQEAHDEYASSVAASERNWVALRGLAASQAQLGQLVDAERSYSAALALRADDVFAFDGLFSLLSRAERLDQAEQLALDFARTRPDLALGLQRAGRVRFARGDWEGAARAFEAGLERARLDFDCAYSLGRARQELRDDARALAAYETALKADAPGDLAFLRDAYARAIRLNLAHGERERAEVLARQMRTRLPGDASVDDVLRQLGIAD